MSRTAALERTTKETRVHATVNLDGDGTKSRIETPVGFLSHMIDVIARHGRVDIDVVATGDTFIDYHHTVEDVGLVLGEAFGKALGDKAGIRRFGYAYVPLDELLDMAKSSLHKELPDLSSPAALTEHEQTAGRDDFPHARFVGSEPEKANSAGLVDRDGQFDEVATLREI